MEQLLCLYRGLNSLLVSRYVTFLIFLVANVLAIQFFCFFELRKDFSYSDSRIVQFLVDLQFVVQICVYLVQSDFLPRISPRAIVFLFIGTSPTSHDTSCYSLQPPIYACLVQIKASVTFIVHHQNPADVKKNGDFVLLLQGVLHISCIQLYLKIIFIEHQSIYKIKSIQTCQ